MRGNVALIPEIRDKMKNMLPHEDTVAYKVGFCKDERLSEGTVQGCYVPLNGLVFWTSALC